MAPVTGEGGCNFQAIMFQTGNVASAIASFYIGVFVWSNIHFLHYSWMITPGVKFERLVVFSVFGLSIIFCIIGELRSLAIKMPIYVPIGFKSWCWISEKFPLERLMIHYTWIFLICFCLFVFYFHIMITLNTSNPDAESMSSKGDSGKKRRLALKMIGFPIVFFCAFVPLGIERVITYASNSTVKVPPSYIGFAVSLFVANGFLNAFLYGYTRRLFQKAVGYSSDITVATPTPTA